MSQPTASESEENTEDLDVPFDPFFVPIDDAEGSDVSIVLSEDASYEIEMEEYFDRLTAFQEEKLRIQKAQMEAEMEVLVYDDPKKKKKVADDDDLGAESKKDHVTKRLFMRPEPPPSTIDGDEGAHLMFLDESIPRRTERASGKSHSAGTVENLPRTAVRVSVSEETAEPLDMVEIKVGAPPKRPFCDLKETRLTKEDLNEPMQRGLIPRDADEDPFKAIWNFKKSEWVTVPLVTGEFELFTLEGNSFYIAPEDVELSEDDVAEFDSDGGLLPPLPTVRTGQQDYDDSSSEDEAALQEDAGGENEDEEEEAEGEVDDAEKTAPEAKKSATEKEKPPEEEKKKKRKKPKKLLSNMFNYADREVLTVIAITMENGVQTVPPPKATFRHFVAQWNIFDSYQRDHAAVVAAKEKEAREKQVFQRAEIRDPNEKSVAFSPEEAYSYTYLKAVQRLERLMSQNTFEDIAFDAQFFDDPADKYKEPEGTLLPLWEFDYDKTKGTVVTDIKWSPRYFDMFAASFGTYHVNAFRPKGMVCVYTLKNPSFPEYKFNFKSGCQTIDIHDKEPYYLAIGLYDGYVAILNIKNEGKPFRLESDITKKHVGVVWEVQWCNDPRDRQLGFYSAGADGRIFKWLVNTHELAMTPIIRLELNSETMGFDRVLPHQTAHATSLTFKPDNLEIFLVGTAEGAIFQCSISYTSSYLYVYFAHQLSVYRMAYNPYFPKVFASASCDWKLKIWEDSKPDPLFIFDLYCAVMDVQWAPYSSTVLAATTSDGRLHLFDLSVNQLAPICVQSVCPPQMGYTTRLRFNWKLPFLVVGDSKGLLVIMKVSPNCRRPTVLGKKKRGKDKLKDDPKRLELMKFKRIFQYVREKDVLQPMADLDTRTAEEKMRLAEKWMQTGA